MLWLIFVFVCVCVFMSLTTVGFVVIASVIHCLESLVSRTSCSVLRGTLSSVCALTDD